MALFKRLSGSLALLCILASTSALANDIDGYYRVAYDNCGVSGEQSHMRVGNSYAYPLKDIPIEKVAKDSPARTVAFDTKHVILSYEGLPVEAAYKLKLTLLSDAPRCQTITLNGKPVERQFELKKGKVYTLTYDLPKRACAQGRLDVRIKHESGPNAVLSEATLYSTAKRLEPVLSMSASGNFDRQIRGHVLDLNNKAPISNVSVTVSVPNTDLSLDTKTDRTGEFCVTVPGDWQAAAQNGLLVEAKLATSSLKQMIDVIELFPPRLIPKPTQTGNVQHPILSLVGTWKFSPMSPEDFPECVNEVQTFADINVPGEWVMQGFDVPEGKAAGYYREFDVPTDFQGSRIILHCDAVYALSEIWINGEKVGVHAGGMTAFQFDITEQVKAGHKNSIAMKVINETQTDVLASGSQYAVHALGGITRKLYVQAIPQVAVTTFDISTTFDAAYCDADIHLALAIENVSNALFKDGKIHFSLRKSTGQRIELSEHSVKLGPIAADTHHRQAVTLHVPQPKTWDPEHPHLYILEGTLYSDNRVVEVVRRRFGFRQIEVRGDRVFVNNHEIKLRGVCRHEVHPLRGRSLTPAQWRRDAELYRAANINYIRTSHYPPAEEFLDACDELGLFVECEAPLCWVQHGANSNWRKSGWNYLDPNLYVPLLRANLESIAFNRRHPSIIIWSLANESRWSPLWAKVLEAVEQYDPTRPTTFHDQCYGGYNNAGSTAQIANMHYPGPRGPSEAASQARPLLFGEYCHLNAYNRYELVTDPGLRDAWGRGFKAMWDSMYQTPGCLGGALWSGIDDTFHLPSGHTVGYGTWGPIDGWRRPKPEYYHVKKTYSPVRISQGSLEVPRPGDTLIVPVENRHDFTNLKELKIRWRIGHKAGDIQADIPPRQAGQLHIKTDLTQLEGQSLDLQFIHPERGLVDAYLLPIGKTSSQDTPKITSNQTNPSLTLTETKNAIVIQGETLAYEIDRHSGHIMRAQLNGLPRLVGGPELLVLPLNAKGGTQMTKEAQVFAPFTEVCAGRTVNSVTARQEDGRVVINVSDTYAQARGGYRLIVDSQGGLTIEYSYTILQEVNPRQWGLVLTVPKALDTLSWKRSGLWTVYPKDHIGRLSGSTPTFVGNERCGPSGPRTQPNYAWMLDSSALGTHDFRSTKESITQASLTNNMDGGVFVRSNGEQHVRTWVDNQQIKLLVAEYSNAGAEGFFRSHAAVEDRPLKVGDIIKGSITLQLQ